MTTTIPIDGNPILLLLTPNSAPPSITSLLRSHGYTVLHIPNATSVSLADVTDEFSNSMPYGIVAFSDACAPALDLAVSPSRNLRAVVGYNPPSAAVPGYMYRDRVEVVLHRSRLEVEEGVAPQQERPGKGHGHGGKVYWYDVETVEEGDRVAMVRTLETLKSTLGGCTGVEEAVGLDGRGVWRRVIGVDAVVDEDLEGRCVVRDVAGGFVIGERVYMTREAWEMENMGRKVGEA